MPEKSATSVHCDEFEDVQISSKHESELHLEKYCLIVGTTSHRTCPPPESLQWQIVAWLLVLHTTIAVGGLIPLVLVNWIEYILHTPNGTSNCLYYCFASIIPLSVTFYQCLSAYIMELHFARSEFHSRYMKCIEIYCASTIVAAVQTTFIHLCIWSDKSSSEGSTQPTRTNN